MNEAGQASILLRKHSMRTTVTANRWRRARASGRKARRGAAAVEFAIVAPIFLFSVIMPMIEFGRGMVVTNSLAATAEVGCRTGVLPGSTNTTVSTAITNSLTAQAISGANSPTIKVNGSSADVST